MTERENIQVQIRARPIQSNEGENVWVIDKDCIATRGAGWKTQEFHFDHIFDHNADTKAVYSTAARDIVESAIGGYNGTIFAYGQTGSGKTYTMGGAQHNGIIDLAIEDIFGRIENQQQHRKFTLKLSYVELYNESFRDLLNPTTPVHLREGCDGTFVSGLSHITVDSAPEVVRLLQTGTDNRTVGVTNMNAYSSRSHTLLQLNIDSTVINSQPSTAEAEARSSTLWFVDLAGSERASKTGAEGKHQKEGAYINKSLLTLSTVINHLSHSSGSSSGASSAPAYRNSKLTHLLKKSLGGDSKTLIICTVTTAACSKAETLQTLGFAKRAKAIKNKPCLNEHMTDRQLYLKYKKMYDELRMNYLSRPQQHGTTSHNNTQGTPNKHSTTSTDSVPPVCCVITSGVQTDESGDKSGKMHHELLQVQQRLQAMEHWYQQHKLHAEQPNVVNNPGTPQHLVGVHPNCGSSTCTPTKQQHHRDQVPTNTTTTSNANGRSVSSPLTYANPNLMDFCGIRKGAEKRQRSKSVEDILHTPKRLKFGHSHSTPNRSSSSCTQKQRTTTSGSALILRKNSDTTDLETELSKMSRRDLEKYCLQQQAAMKQMKTHYLQERLVFVSQLEADTVNAMKHIVV